MNAENMNQILDELAVRFGATGAELWEQLVLYQGVFVVTAVGISLTVAALFFYGTRYFWKKSKEDDSWEILGVVCGVVALIAILIVPFAIADLILWLIAPDAATLKGLLP